MAPADILALACVLVYAIPMGCTLWAFTHHSDRVEEQGLLMLALVRRVGVLTAVTMMFSGGIVMALLARHFYPDGLWVMLAIFLQNAWNDMRALWQLRMRRTESH